MQADLREPDACERVVDETVDALGRLDILVNMASIYRADAARRPDGRGLGRSARRRSARRRGCARARRCRTCGGCAAAAIINFSDWVARSGRPRYRGYLTYYVAKAGVIALTEGLALELAGDQILVNAIAPGPIAAPEGTSDEEFAERRAGHAAGPLGRRDRDRQGRAGAGRQRLHHGRDDPRRRRQALEVVDWLRRWRVGRVSGRRLGLSTS